MLNFQTVVTGQNITLVYKTLDPQRIDTNRLRQLLGGEQKQLLQGPDGIRVSYPAEEAVVQITQNRILVICQKRGQAIGDIPLWEVACGCHGLVSEAQLIAYGFNYNLEVTLNEGGVSQALTRILAPDIGKVGRAVDGDVLAVTFNARVVFRHGQVPYNLLLQPMDEQRIQVNLNAHFEYDGISLPAPEQLEACFRREFEGFSSLLSRLFGEGGEQAKLNL